MRALLDTHALIWWMNDDRRMSKTARNAIAAIDEPLIGAGTLFEAAIKQSIGKLKLPSAWIDALTGRDRFSLLPILPSHAAALGGLPFVEVKGIEVRDPFDRLLVAQANVEGVPVITRDPAIAAHGVPTIW